MQPLLENSHNPLVPLSTNHLLTPSEFKNHIIIETLWTHVSKGWTHGTRATCVAWFPTKGTDAPIHRPTIPRDVKVDKHQVERAKLSTQLGNAYPSGLESRSIKVECVKLFNYLASAFSMGLNHVHVKWSSLKLSTDPTESYIF